MLPHSLTSATSFIDLLLDAVCVVDAEGRFVYVSSACERIFGYRQQEMTGMKMIDLVAPEDRARTLEVAQRVMEGHPLPHFENRYVRKDGSIVHIMWSARWSEEDQLRIAVARDITAIKRNEAKQAALYAISEAAHACSDVPALVRQVHATIAGLLPAPGLSVALAEGGRQLEFVYHADRIGEAPTLPPPHSLCAEVVRTGAPIVWGASAAADRCCWLGVPLSAQQQTIGALAVHSGPDDPAFTDSDAELLQFVSTQVATAIQRTQMHARLERMAQYDELTGLPNRRLLVDRIGNAIARAGRQHGTFGLLYLDLNGFKKVNDMFGHEVGDIVLREVAVRLGQCVRGADTVARLGGDEFVVLLESIAQRSDAERVADKIRETVHQPLDIGAGRRLHMWPSIGVALYPAHGTSMDQLLRHADAEMYAVKQSSGDVRP